MPRRVSILAVLSLDVKTEPDVRVGPLHLRERSGEFDRLCGVELRRVSVVRKGNGGQK